MSLLCIMEKMPFSTLRQFIGQLITSYQPVAVNQNSFFINDVSPAIALDADPGTIGTLSLLLGSLFYLVGRSSSDASLRVQASTFDNTVVLDICDESESNKYFFLEKLDHIRMLTRRIGGILDITRRGINGTMISLSFINNKEVLSGNNP